MLIRTTQLPRMAYQQWKHFRSFEYSLLASNCSNMVFNTKMNNTHLRLGSTEKQFLKFSPSMHCWNCTRNIQNQRPGPGTKAMGVRLSNENGYLSWCRNSYLSCSVAVIITNLGPDDVVLHSAAAGALLISLLNVTAGSTSYIIHILALRRLVKMSEITSLLHISFVVIHFCVFVGVLLLFHKYANDQLEETEQEKQDVS